MSTKELIRPKIEPYHFHDPELALMAVLAKLTGAEMALTYLTAAVADSMLTAITTTGLYLGIHSASPSNTGANEIVGSGMIGYSSGGYTGVRQTVAWASSSGGVVVSNDTQTFALLATQAGGVPYASLWTDTGATSHAGTFLTGLTTSGWSGSLPSGANLTVTSAVTLTVSG